MKIASLARVLALVVTFAFANVQTAYSASAAMNDDSAIVQLYTCPSRTLKVDINVDGKSSKNEVLSALRIFSSYPSLKLTAVWAPAPSASFLLRLSVACESAECVTVAGWTEVQWRLLPLKGVSLSCVETNSSGGGEMAPAPANAAKSGGVIGSN